MLYLEFVVTEDKLGIAETVDLVEGGADITVDKNNLPAYLEAQLRYRLMNRIKGQLLEFLKGFYDVVPEPLLSVFDFQEGTLVCHTTLFQHTLSTHPFNTPFQHTLSTLTSFLFLSSIYSSLFSIDDANFLSHHSLYFSLHHYCSLASPVELLLHGLPNIDMDDWIRQVGK